MPRHIKFEAEHSIANALSVLECIPHSEHRLASLAEAIEHYLDGRFEAATTRAQDAAKGCALTSDRLTAAHDTTLDDLRRTFIAARLKIQRRQ